ncbi:hypothetical protein BKA81DRAFT_378313 [Phyllosticta paracitricarpa]
MPFTLSPIAINQLTNLPSDRFWPPASLPPLLFDSPSLGANKRQRQLFPAHAVKSQFDWGKKSSRYATSCCFLSPKNQGYNGGGGVSQGISVAATAHAAIVAAVGQLVEDETAANMVPRRDSASSASAARGRVHLLRDSAGGGVVRVLCRACCLGDGMS